jgi:hypothetical protein
MISCTPILSLIYVDILEEEARRSMRTTCSGTSLLDQAHEAQRRREAEERRKGRQPEKLIIKIVCLHMTF